MKNKSKLKIWTRIGVVATTVVSTYCAQIAFAADGEAGEAGEKGEQGIAQMSGAYEGRFDRALELMFMGEGGEGGLGLSRMGPTVSVPALTSEQIEKALTGNTLAIPYHYVLHYKSNGRVSGYTVEYAPAPNVSDCPAVEVKGDKYLAYEGACSIRTSVKWSGKWKVKNDRLCMDVKWVRGHEKDCYYVAFMLDKVALFKSNGTLSAKGHVLKKGFQTDE